MEFCVNEELGKNIRGEGLLFFFNLLFVVSLCSEPDSTEWELSKWHSGIAGREALHSSFPTPYILLCPLCLHSVQNLLHQILKAGPPDHALPTAAVLNPQHWFLHLILTTHSVIVKISGNVTSLPKIGKMLT